MQISKILIVECDCQKGKPLGDGKTKPEYYTNKLDGVSRLLQCILKEELYFAIHAGKHLLGVVLDDGTVINCNSVKEPK